MADSRSAPTSPGPADLLRARLTSGRGRLAVIAATTCVPVQRGAVVSRLLDELLHNTMAD